MSVYKCQDSGVCAHIALEQGGDLDTVEEARHAGTVLWNTGGPKPDAKL
jgi:hypothetical protein